APGPIEAPHGRLDSERERLTIRVEGTTREVLPGRAPLETSDGGSIAPQALETERCPSNDVALAQAGGVWARPLRPVGEADAEIQQGCIVLGPERSDAERRPDRRGQARRRERRPEAAVRAREVVSADDRTRAGVDADEDEAQARAEIVRQRRERVAHLSGPAVGAAIRRDSTGSTWLGEAAMLLLTRKTATH